MGGAGSVPELSDLALPELHVDFQGTPSASALAALGYRETPAGWEHTGGYRLIFATEGSGWLAEQAALRVKAVARYAQQVGFAPAEFAAPLFGGMGRIGCSRRAWRSTSTSAA